MDTFIKFPDNLVVIPEIYAFYQTPAFQILTVLLAYGFHSDTPAYNNKSHKTAILAEKHKKGIFASLFSNKTLRESTGLSESSIGRGITLLEHLGLVKTEKLGQEGTLYYLGIVDKQNKNSVTTNLMSLGEKASTREGAIEVQSFLIEKLEIKAKAKPIHSIKFKKEIETVEEKKEEKQEVQVEKAQEEKKREEKKEETKMEVEKEKTAEAVVEAEKKIIDFFSSDRTKVEQSKVESLLNFKGDDYKIRLSESFLNLQLKEEDFAEIKLHPSVWMNRIVRESYSETGQRGD